MSKRNIDWLISFGLIIPIALMIAYFFVPHKAESKEIPYRIIYLEDENDKHIPEVDFICRINPNISNEEARQIFEIVVEVVDEYRKDKFYNKGAAVNITAPIVLGVIAVESGFVKTTKGSSGEMGLMQVIPKYHIKSLRKAGILKHKVELWNVRTNIKAGVYVLMHNARNSKSVKEALAKYNSGKRIEDGIPYATKVINTASRIYS